MNNIFSKESVLSRVRDNYTYFGDESMINVATMRVEFAAKAYKRTIELLEFKKYLYYKGASDIEENYDTNNRRNISVEDLPVGKYTIWHRDEAKEKVEGVLKSYDRPTFSRDQRVALSCVGGKDLLIEITTSIEKNNHFSSKETHIDKYTTYETLTLDDPLYITIIFVGTNNPPIVKVTLNPIIEDGVFRFNPTSCIFDSSKSKFNIEKTTIKRETNKFSCPIMTYEAKTDDIMKYLDNETIDIDEYSGDVIYYKNEKTGIVYNVSELDDSMTTYIKDRKYILYGEKTDSDGSKIIVEPFGTTKIDSDNVPSTITKLSEEIDPITGLYSIAKSFLDQTHSELMHAESDDAMFISSCRVIDDNGLIVVYVNEPTGEKFALRVYLNDNNEPEYYIMHGSVAQNIIVLDADMNIILTTQSDYMKQDHEDISGLKYIRSMSLNGNDILMHYSDPFITYTFNQNTGKFESFSSSLYNISDNFIYTRNTWGVPEKTVLSK